MKKKKLEILSFSAALLVLLGVINARINVNSNEEEAKENIVLEEPEKSEIVRYQLFYLNDTVDTDDSINSLGINENNNYPYKSYKFVRFVNYDHYEKYAIVNVYVDYIIDTDGNVVGSTYNYVDAFNGRLILSTSDRDEIKEYNSDMVMHLMEYGELLDLKESVISKGLDSEYANSVMSDDIKNKTLSTYDVARMYVLLVNSNNRLENEYTMTIN